MDGIEKILKNRGQQKKRGPQSARAEMIDRVMEFMGEGRQLDDDQEVTNWRNMRFKFWLGRTRHLSPSDMYGMMREASEGKNPRALFNWLIKNNVKNKRL